MTYKGIFEEAIELAKFKKRAQEAEGELSILKGIETNRVKEAQAKTDQLQNELDRVKKENNDLFNRIADALTVNLEHQKINGELRKDLDLAREDNQLLSIENGRMMKKLSNPDS